MPDAKPKPLYAMTKAELLIRAEELEVEVAMLRETPEVDWGGSKPPAAAPAHASEGVVMVIHLGGVGWNGTERQIVRCAPTGPLADSWMVQVGAKLLLNDGKQSIPARAFHHLPSALQRRAAWSREAAIKAALGA